jgi:hypothetical protein
MKLFYSYSHKDEQYKEDMEKHLALLKKEGRLDDWSDRKILTGESINNEIDSNLLDSDIICLLMSHEFIASDACMKELGVALKRRTEEGISIVPIILSPCSWQDTELKELKAQPKDAKPLSQCVDKEQAWLDIYVEIKEIIKRRTAPEINAEHKKALEDTELASVLGKTVTLSDIFVPMDFKKIDFKDKQDDINFTDFVEKYIKSPENVILSGDQQSGKSALLKQVFFKLQLKYIPIYVNCSLGFSGGLTNVINRNFKKQYCSSEDVIYFSLKKIILFDDFHKIKTEEREKIIEAIKDEKNIKMIVTVDDIYNLGIKEQLLTKVFQHYKIKKMGYDLRDDLICKWMVVNGRNYEEDTLYREELTTRIDTVIQKTIVPAYPFFIYTIIAAHDIISPLNSEITSQGHCYQALIYFALRKAGATDLQIDMYINFLSELASSLHRSNNKILTVDEINLFLEHYCEQFTISIEKENIIKNLINANILNCSSLQEYSFKYPYIYFYFVGKYFSEHVEEFKSTIENIINNLQEEENGYILIFLIHHSKNIKILEHIEVNLLCLFDKQKETTLANIEIEHLNKYAESLEPLVIDKITDVEKNRKEVLVKKDQKDEKESDRNSNIKEDSLMSDLRRAIKTVEVAGHILKNRSGSLKVTEQRKFLGAAMNVFLRITDSFLSEFQRNEKDFVEYISYLVSKKLTNEKGVQIIDEGKARKIAAKIFFNINLITCYATIRRISDSICSKELLTVMDEVCDKKLTPISYLIKKQCKMQYKGSVDVKDIKDNFNSMSFLAQRLLANLVLEHCYMHKIDYKDRQNISKVLGIKEKLVPFAR